MTDLNERGIWDGFWDSYREYGEPLPELIENVEGVASATDDVVWLREEGFLT